MCFFSATTAFADFYVVNSVDIDAILHEERSVTVTETYIGFLDDDFETLPFALPLSDTINTSTQSVTVNNDYSDIEIHLISGEERESVDFDTIVEGNNLVINTVGTTFPAGNNTISLSYKNSYGPDNTIGADELFFRAVRPERLSSMGSVSMTFEFPLPLSSDSVSVSSSVDANAMTFSLDGTTLTANNLLSIPEVHDVTLHAVLEDEYFLMVEETLFSFNPMVYTFCGAILGLAILVALLTGIKHRVKSGNINHPPSDFSPIELLLLSGRKLSRRSVLGAIFGLASCGAVSLSFGERGLIITKGRDIQLQQVQKELFDTIFAGGDSVTLDKDSVDNLINTLQESAQKNLDRSAELDDNIAFGLCSAFIFLVGVVSGVLIGIGYGLDFGMTRLLIYAVGIGGATLVGGLIMQLGFARRRKKKITILHFIGFVISLFATVWGVMIIFPSSETPMLIMFIAAFVVTAILAASGRKSRYYTEVMSDLGSLNKFLVNPSSEQLKRLVTAQPDYIQQIFPHAVSFGYERTLLDRVAEAGIEIPESDSMPSPFELQEVVPD